MLQIGLNDRGWDLVQHMRARAGGPVTPPLLWNLWIGDNTTRQEAVVALAEAKLNRSGIALGFNDSSFHAYRAFVVEKFAGSSEP